ncbi:translocation/assembly module TamB domain-containing protein [Microbaculum marinum]|uniref:Translocation/assembly module TamB domain-containing protein n=1 Tax=Microbaculum marinum TaxID=1764581 RepID=A0AAW9RSP0_9HYPH
MRSRTRRIAGIVSALLLIPLLLVGGLFVFIQTPPGRGLIVWAAETFGSTETAELRIGSLQGRIPFDMTVRDVSLSDADGAWLDVDRARLAWRPFALAAGVLSIETVDVGDVSILRLPPAREAAPEPGGGGIPVLPFEIVVDRLNVDRIALGEPVLGEPAAVTVTGDARLGDPADGLALRLDVERVDGTAGTIAARLGYRPQDQYLDLDLTVDEPAGGLVSRLSGMPGLPPLRISVDGVGPIDDFAATIDLTAGDQGDADGTVTVTRRALPGGGAGRALALDLQGEVAGLLQPAYAPLAEGRSTLAARVVFPDEGPITIESLEALTAAGWVSVSGSVDPQTMSARLAYEVIAGEAKRFAGILPVAASWRGIEVSGRADYGPGSAALSANLLAEDVAVEGNSVAALDLSMSADADGPLDDPDTPIAVAANGRASGVATADSSYAGAAGESVALDVTGTATPAGRFEADALKLVLGAGEILWAGVIDAAGFDGNLTASNVDLSSFAGLSGLDLTGIAGLKADLAGSFDGARLSATVDGGIEGFGTGIAQLDGALGESFTVSGGAERDADGSFAFDDLTVSGAALKLVADGRADEARADVDAEIELTDLARLDPRVTGSARATARLTGSLEDLALQARVAIDEATAMDRPIENLTVEVDATDVTEAPSGALKLSGTVDGQAATGSGRIAREDGGFEISGLDIVIGSVRVAGNVRLDADNKAAGQVVVKAANLGDLSVFTLTEMAGKVDATVDLAVENGVQVVRAKASASGVSAFDTRIGSADLTADVRDPTGRLIVDADVTARAIDAGGQRIDSLRLTASGGVEENAFTLETSGLGASVSARGGVALVDGDITVNLAAMTLSGGGQTGTLARPATIRVADGGVAISNFSLATGGGGIDVNGTAGETLDLQVAIRALPLSLAEIAAPGTGLSGTLSGSANVRGSAASPSGQYDLQVSGLSIAAMRQAGIDPASITASGQLANGRTTVNARITGGSGTNVTISGSAPLSASGGLDLGIDGRFDLAMLNNMLAASGDRVSGPVTVDMRVRGTAAAPDASGTIRMTGGTYSSPLNGVNLDNIALEARGGLQRIEITRLSARAPNGGTISGSGTVGLSGDLPVNVTLNAEDAQIINNDLVDATIDAALRLTGPAATGPDLAGTVTIRRMDIQLPDRLPASITPIPVEHVNTPPAVQAQLDEEQALGGQGGGGGDFDVALDLKVSTTNRIFVRGMGVDAQLGGGITIRGTSSTPIVQGGFELRRGYIDVIGQRIDFTRGIITFPGTDKIDPQLDLVAETTTSSITGIVTIGGRASNPTIQLSSSPALPQDEVLAHILFDRATGQLTAGQAVQLAQAAATLAGIGGGPGMLDSIRRKFGLDVLQITTAGDDPAIGIGRYINDNIYLGVTQGTSAQSSRVTVDIDITDNIRARGEVGADGSSSVGINMEWDY